jgi:hypothetical protein
MNEKEKNIGMAWGKSRMKKAHKIQSLKTARKIVEREKCVASECWSNGQTHSLIFLP